MKSQHRHELQTNELGKVADKVYASAGSFFERHGNKLMMAISVGCIAGAIAMVKIRGERERQAAAWRDLAAATRADDFADIWKSHPDTVAAQWAHVHEGESRLAEGVQLLFSNVEAATAELKRAREALQAVVDRKSAPASVRERGLFALARCLEALSDGNESEALSTYEQFRREFPGSIYKKDVESRIAVLKEQSGEEFYAWFATYARPKATERKPRDVGGEARFNNDGDLIDTLPDDTAEGASGDAAEGLDAEEMPPEPAGPNPAEEAPLEGQPPEGESTEESGAEQTPAKSEGESAPPSP